jgi:hypothetical protein
MKEEMKAKLDPDQEEVQDIREKIEFNKAEMMAIMTAVLEEMEAEVETNQEEVNAMDLESNPEEKVVVVEHQEVPNEETAVVTIGALEDRYGDLHLAVGCCREPKKRKQGDGGSRKKLAAARRRLTGHAFSARHKGRSHKGPTVKKRRRKGPECNNGIRNRGLKEQLRLGSNRAFNKTVRQIIGMEVAKRPDEFSIGLRKMSDWILWRSRPPPKRKKRLLAARVPAL